MLTAALTRLTEVGRVISAENETRLRQAVAAVQAVLAALQAQPATPAPPAPPGGSQGAVPPPPTPAAPVVPRMESAPLSFALADAVAGWLTEGTVPSVEREEWPLVGDLIPLVEARAVARDGVTRLKVIQPGWGSSGYYPADMLRRDGPKVFSQGTKMFWDHPTDEQESARPEGSLRDLAGELVGDARYLDDGPAGPGLYADAKVFRPFSENLDELAPHIGVSIRAMGRGQAGTVEGRTGRVIEELTDATSIDYVTTPGAGGQVLQLFEAARRPITPAVVPQEDHMTDQERIAALEARAKEHDAETAKLQEERDEARTEAARGREWRLAREAQAFVAGQLAEARGLLEPTRARLVEQIKPVLKEDGKLDEPAMKEAIAKAVKEEVAYLTSVTGGGSVKGMGSTDKGAASYDLEADFRGLGLSESAAKIAAVGRH